MTCLKCGEPLPEAEKGWNRARVCPDCRALQQANHALDLGKRDDDE